MKVFQAPIEIAGQMGLLTKGLKALGHEVKSYNLWTTYLAYRRHIHNVSLSRLQSTFERHKAEFDVFHFHYGQGFTTNHAEFRYAGRKGKVALMHYWGSDVRTESKATANNPYAKLIGQFEDERRVKRHLKRHSRYFPACIVQDFEVVPYVVEYFDRVYVLPVAVDLAKFTPRYPSGEGEEPVILHAPTQPYFKGTAYIEETLQRLRDEGFRFRYQKVEGMSHEEALKQYKTADLVIDQVLCGSHGLFAVEAMAYGKPVISYIREDLRMHFPEDLPIVSANPATLYDAVRRLLVHPETWAEMGRKGRRYVERCHALPAVAKSLDWIYRRERRLRETGDEHPTRPCVIQWLGAELRCYPIHRSTRRVDVRQIPVPKPKRSGVRRGSRIAARTQVRGVR
ncbi:hypothetical protein GCM10025857_08700 [Alicyclobacillus contaminans]|uniref:glycosyltransferase family protein n=1 Tax=Alicyclobacillus contaminans TaxID=392016 RepID=UPI0004235AFD|nr:glycosyltransferase [Alicyclobacillus contaminans]GMA49513.1 hypothetical protein GCM10025857_08700 [Alicyclobacillus contaminans]